MAANGVHHVQLHVKNGLQMLRKFTNCLHFQLFAERRTGVFHQWAVRSGSAVFIINERAHSSPAHAGFSNPGSAMLEQFGNGPVKHAFNDLSTAITASHRSEHKLVNSVVDVAFEVTDVDKVLNRARDNGAGVLHEPTDWQDSMGIVRYAAVRSNVGDVVHSLLDTSKYKGKFLPGFNMSSPTTEHPHSDNACSKTGLVSHFDHVTYACPNGMADSILEFYEKCFGYKRFLVNRSEDVDEGFLVQGEDMGMRLKAMEYWKCAETHLYSPRKNQASDLPDVKFVIAEPLPGQGPNQVDTFIENHGGPGIQHIGLHTSDIVNAVSTLQDEKLPLIVPPDTYYSEIGKLQEIQDVGENIELMKRYGILLDSEADAGEFDAVSSDEQRYLMQVFTQPIFEENTFFLEVIQRHGATGFGAGNISALWRSVQAYMDEQNEKKVKMQDEQS
ncbi:4-hydroxyphenylpyruvate dioxygenase-like protein [Ptychodera flava]|uniref:4-hydroxyphenylpyruvate dioxygenase-like protein n=1 Tax=Ptychodera flava TaxID=63121 RepID=UPI003969E669